MTATLTKAWTAFVRPLTGGTARVIVRQAGGPAAIGGVPDRPDRDFRLVAGSRPAGEAFDRTVAEAYVRRFNEEGLINAFVRMSKDKWITRNGDMTLERIRTEADEEAYWKGVDERLAVRIPTADEVAEEAARYEADDLMRKAVIVDEAAKYLEADKVSRKAAEDEGYRDGYYNLDRNGAFYGCHRLAYEAAYGYGKAGKLGRPELRDATDERMIEAQLADKG